MQSKEISKAQELMRDSKLYTVSDQFRVLVFRDAPRLIFTGLTKAIGSPRDYEKNLEDPKYFDSTIDISIPHTNTKELKVATLQVKPI